MKLIQKTIKILFLFSERIIFHSLRPFINHTNLTNKEEFTIGITTFMDRFDNDLKPLLKKTSILFPNSQIIVIANGHFRGQMQAQYLKKIAIFCKKIDNTKLIAYSNPKGLSYLWNQIIKNAYHKQILILNDDLNMTIGFSQFINSTSILNENIATINMSWSHFLITKQLVNKIGWFDEQLTEIGGEDDDYAARLALNNICISNFNTRTISSKSRKKRNKLTYNTFGKDMRKEKGGYSTLNTEYLNKKWETSMNRFNGATEVPNRNMKFWKLRLTDKKD